MDSNIFFALPFETQMKIVYSMDSKELTELHEQVDKYIVENGINDTLRYLLDKTFSISYLRGIEEENPGYSLIARRKDENIREIFGLGNRTIER